MRPVKSPRNVKLYHPYAFAYDVTPSPPRQENSASDHDMKQSIAKSPELSEEDVIVDEDPPNQHDGLLPTRKPRPYAPPSSSEKSHSSPGKSEKGGIRSPGNVNSSPGESEEGKIRSPELNFL